MPKANKHQNTLILLLIIFAGSALRLYNLFEIPFTHDEFSALFRTNFQSFSELIEKGVKVDGHPAGIQVFLYYWTKLFGYSEPIVKLPFIFFGILSIWIVFLIGKDWFNETVGLISASFLASIQFSIMSSQIARPYASGMLFSLIMVFFWSRLVFKPQRKYFLNALLYIISSALCAYNHHFSLLFAIIVGLSGLFYIERKYLRNYILSGVFIFLLYVPHLKVFFYQLNNGGIGDWLGKPHFDFILNYLGYIFQFSFYIFTIATLLILLGFHKFKQRQFNSGFIKLSFIWFILPLVVGYLYSTFINSVLQFNVLIFSFPFLFFMLFGHIGLKKPLLNFFLVIIILSVNMLVLVFERKHYQLFYNSPYEALLLDYQSIKSQNFKTISFIDSDRKISAYYISKRQIDTSFCWYDTFKNEKEFMNYLEKKSSNADNLYFGCLSGSNPLIIPIITDYFPYLVWQKNYAGGTSYYFSKNNGQPTKLVDQLDFETNIKNWTSIDNNQIISVDNIQNGKSYLLDSLSEWSPTFSKKLDEIIDNGNNFIDISVKIYKPDSFCHAVLVGSIQKGEKIIYWNGIGFNTFIDSLPATNNWYTIHNSLKLSDIYLNYNNLILKVYIWNKEKQPLIIDDFSIHLRQGNPLIYGLFEKF
jgi:uncharacterized membrane protein